MRSVTFNFRPDVSAERQRQVLEQVGAWDDVRKASHLKPGAKHPLLLRMAYAYLDDAADEAGVVERLSGLPEIESAAKPARRRLVRAAAGKKPGGR